MPRLVDLSQEIYQGMGVYPGHLKTVVWDHASHAETVKFFDGGFSFHSQGLMMCDHGPTHVDAISHLDPGRGRAEHRRDAARHVLRAGAVHRRLARRAAGLHHRRRPRPGAGRGGQALEPGDALLMRTGAFERYGGTADYTTRYTGLDEDAGELARRARREGLRGRLAEPGQPDQPHLPGAHDVPRPATSRTTRTSRTSTR